MHLVASLALPEEVQDSVYPEAVACALCGARWEVDDDTAELPACPECGAPDTWERRQGAAFRALVAEIDDQAGVAWTRYRLR